MIHKTAIIYDNVIIGNDVVIGPNCVIGYDGFQFARDKYGIPTYKEHLGGVIIEDGVTIQANCVVSRALLEYHNTIIGKYTAIGNMVHIGHGCRRGSGNIFSGRSHMCGHVTLHDDNFFAFDQKINFGFICFEWEISPAEIIPVKSSIQIS
jgi:UDP-3-O-[3-hydroxymyristoyl] glucosamine N-acyltransferase